MGALIVQERKESTIPEEGEKKKYRKGSLTAFYLSKREKKKKRGGGMRGGFPSLPLLRKEEDEAHIFPQRH